MPEPSTTCAAVQAILRRNRGAILCPRAKGMAVVPKPAIPTSSGRCKSVTAMENTRAQGVVACGDAAALPWKKKISGKACDVVRKVRKHSFSPFHAHDGTRDGARSGSIVSWISLSNCISRIVDNGGREIPLQRTILRFVPLTVRPLRRVTSPMRWVAARRTKTARGVCLSIDTPGSSVHIDAGHVVRHRRCRDSLVVRPGAQVPGGTRAMAWGTIPCVSKRSAFCRAARHAMRDAPFASRK